MREPPCHGIFSRLVAPRVNFSKKTLTGIVSFPIFSEIFSNQRDAFGVCFLIFMVSMSAGVLSVSPTDQTRNDRDLKFGTHSP